MLMQTSLCNSIETTLLCGSEYQNPVDICDWVYGQTHLMFKDSAGFQNDFLETDPALVGEGLEDDSCLLNFQKNHSRPLPDVEMSCSTQYPFGHSRRKLMSVSKASDPSCVVYKRKKQRGKPILSSENPSASISNSDSMTQKVQNPSSHVMTVTEVVKAPCLMFEDCAGFQNDVFENGPASVREEFEDDSYELSFQNSCSSQFATNKLPCGATNPFVHARGSLLSVSRKSRLSSVVYRRKKQRGRPIFSPEDAIATSANADSRTEKIQDSSFHVMPVPGFVEAPQLMLNECAVFHNDSQETGRSSVGEELEDDSCQSNFQKTYSRRSNVAKISCSTLDPFVHARKKPLSVIKGTGLFSVVYTRKKPRGKPIISSEKVSTTCSDADSMTEKVQNPSSHLMLLTGVAEALHKYSITSDKEIEGSKLDFMERFPNRPDAFPGYFFSRSRYVESCPKDSCSSLKSVLDLSLNSMRMQDDKPAECSSSDAIIDWNIPAKDFCFTVLKNHGLIGGASSTGVRFSVESPAICRSSTCYIQCKICHKSDAAGKMLICDNCEEAFHTYCCNVQLKKIIKDEWFCTSCSKKKRKALKRNHARQAKSVIGAGNCTSTKSDANVIALMLRDTNYTTSVRIGKNFQADVPSWTGPTLSNDDPSCEPLEIKPVNFLQPMKATENPIQQGNWLQCREEDFDGTVCGKWRRAPLLEVQTDDWECYDAVVWDPAHADCAVPQELETEEIVRELEMIRPRLAARRRTHESRRQGGS